MTTTATHDRVTAVANGVTPIPFNFQAISADEVAVLRNDLPEFGTYTVSLNGDGTGTVTPLASWGSDTVTIYSSPDFTQPFDFQRFAAFYPDQFIPALDRLARTMVSLRERFNIIAPDDSLRMDLASPGGDALVAVKLTGIGATLRSLQSKLLERVSVKDFGAIGDGVANDRPAIAAAIATGAKRIIFPDGGTYLLDDAYLVPLTGQTFVGEGGAKLKKATTATFRTKPYFLVKDVTDVTFDGLTFDHQLGAYSKQFAIHAQATTLGSTSRITIRDCIFHRTYCFAERYTSHIRMERCKVYGYGESLGGISTGAVVSLVDGARTNTDGLVSHVWITDCYFEQTVGEPIDINWHTRNLTIADCHFHNCATDGTNEVIDIGNIEPASDANNCSDITLTNLLITNDNALGMTASAIQIKGQTKRVKASNIIARCTGTPQTSGAGIKVWNSHDIQIDGLTVDGFGYGFYTDDEAGSYPTDIILRNFHFSRYGVEGAQLEATRSYFGPGTIVGTGSSSYGIDCVLLTKSTIADVHIRGAAISGIRLQAGSNDNLIRNCDIETSASHGISAAAGCDRVRILGNHFRGNTGTSVNLATSDRNIVQGNLATGNGVNTPATGSLTNSSVANNVTT